ARRLRNSRQEKYVQYPEHHGLAPARRPWRRVAHGLCLLLWTQAALALAAPPGPPPLRDYAVDAWTTGNGLPHNSMRDTAQTTDGYLWFATWEGVVRYNGVDFTTFSRGTAPGLRDNGVGALYVDPRGRLWLSDSRGNLGRYENGRWEYLERPQAWPRALVHYMAMDGAGRLWLLFENHGLGCVHPDGRLDYIAPPPGIPLPASYPRMAIDAADDIWIGSARDRGGRSPAGMGRHASRGGRDRRPGRAAGATGRGHAPGPGDRARVDWWRPVDRFGRGRQRAASRRDGGAGAVRKRRRGSAHRVRLPGGGDALWIATD